MEGNVENETPHPTPGAVPGGEGAAVVVEELPAAQSRKEQIGKIARTDTTGNTKDPQIISRTYEDKTVITIQPPQVDSLKENSDFGKIASTVVGYKGDTNKYTVELIPLPKDKSPFKELNVTSIEESILIGTANAARRENSVISYYALPRGFDPKTNFDPERPQGIMTHSHIPMTSMLCENDHGLMLNDVNYPLVASPHPASTASYVHNIQMRRTGDALDLRFVITASDNNKMVEHYTLGRVWVPLNFCYITFTLSGDNYDAAEPTIAPAFDVLKNPRLMHPKDVSAFTSSLRFVDTIDSRSVHTIYGAFRQLSHVKLSLSRLYWRIWALLFECMYWEEREAVFVATNISTSRIPSEITNATTLNDLLGDALTGENLFFLSESMIDELGHLPLPQYMYLLLSEAWSGNIFYGVNTCWPTLSRTHLCYFGTGARPIPLAHTMTVRSCDLYSILHWFARYTDQLQLIEEIGRTVSTFLYRPEGDSTFMGHDAITLSLPLFRSSRSVLFLWPLDVKAEPYPAKIMPLYKISWIGIVSYMQMALTFNTALISNRVQTLLQLMNQGIRVPQAIITAIDRLFLDRGRSTPIVNLAQSIGIRIGWGQVWNRISGSIVIRGLRIANFNRIVQWSEWLIFERFGVEHTWMMAMMQHCSSERISRLNELYQAKEMASNAIAGSIYYRMDTFGVCDIAILHGSSLRPPTIVEDAVCYTATSGLPLDGQFQDIRINETEWITWGYRIRGAMDTHNITEVWNKRKSYTWELFSYACYSRERALNAQPFMLSMAEAEWGIPGVRETEQRPPQPEVYMTDLVHPDDIPDGVIRFGHPTPGEHRFDPEQSDAGWPYRRPDNQNRRATVAEENQTLVQMYKPEQVSEDLHYCARDRPPTRGEELLTHRTMVPRRHNEYIEPGIIQTLATTRTEYHKHSTIFNQKRLEYKQRQAARRNNSGATTPQTIQQPIIADPVQPTTQHREVIQNALIQVRRNQPVMRSNLSLQENPVKTVWQEEVLPFFAQYRDLGLLPTLKDDDPILSRFFQMTSISPITLQYNDQMRRHVSDIIPIIEQEHYGRLVRPYPLEARGHYCRTIIALLRSVSTYVPSAGANYLSYRRIILDFERLSIGLSSYPFVTQAEWACLGPTVNADGILTFMLGTDSMDALTTYIFNDAMLDEEAIQATVGNEMNQAIAADVVQDPGTNTVYTSWAIPINIETKHSDWGDSKLRAPSTTMWNSSSIHGTVDTEHTGRKHSNINDVIDRFTIYSQRRDIFFTGDTCNRENDAKDQQEEEGWRRNRVRMCFGTINCSKIPKNERLTKLTYINLFNILIARYVQNARSESLGATDDVYPSNAKSKIYLVDDYSEVEIAYECTHNHMDKLGRWRTQCTCPYTGEHLFCNRLWNELEVAQDYVAYSLRGHYPYFDSNHCLVARFNMNEVYTVLEKLRSTAQDLALYDLIFRCTPAVMPAEKRLQYCGINMGFLDIVDKSRVDISHVCTSDCLKWLKDFRTYKDPPPAVKEVFQVHAVYVVEAVPERASIMCAVRRANKDLCDFELGAIFMWWALLPETLLQHFAESGLQWIDHNGPKTDISQRLEIIRQQGSMCRCDLGEESFQWLRKFGNLKGRDFGVCDIDLEERRHRYSYSRRYARICGEAANRCNYLHSFQKHARIVVSQIVASMRSNALDTIDEWWKNRKKHTPKGSTTLRYILDNSRKNDRNITKSDRPNKKAVVEVLQGNILRELLQSTPMSWARRSTKYEPGRKHRALYAVDDLSTIVAAYASQDMEKNMNMFGMCPQQRPNDVLEWWRAHDTSELTQVWLSADYTDFNKEHSAVELQIVNYCFAEAWVEQCGHMRGGLDKAVAACWIARMISRRYVVCSDSDLEFPVYSALWSGSRDTARDNTILHSIYHRMINDTVFSYVREYQPPQKIFMCGDDEDALFNTVVDALVYYEGLKLMGWHSNDTKQMCGFKKHEFLQKGPDNKRGCVGPVSAMIAAMASGQWYKTPGMHQDCAIACISDQAWELHIRGGWLPNVLKIATRLLNAYMKAWHNDDTRGQSVMKKKKLEWLAYRLNIVDIPDKYGAYRGQRFSKGPALWHGTESAYKTGQQPSVFYESQATHGLPHRATQDYCNQYYHLFEKYATEQSFEEYVMDEAAESYGALYHNYIQRQKQKKMWDWPERIASEEDVVSVIQQRLEHHAVAERALTQQMPLIKVILHSQGTKQLPMTDAELLGAVGADINMFKRLGGHENGELVSVLGINRKKRSIYSKWTEIYPELEMVAHLVDPALRSFLLSTGPG